MHNVPYPLDKIINVANELASTSEVIAAAFVLDRMAYIPHGYSVIEAWERLSDDWQAHVKTIKSQYSDLLEPW